MAESDAGARKGRRFPSQEELCDWRALIEASEALNARMSARLQGVSGLSLGDYKVLLELSGAEGERMRSSDLAAAIGWERSRLSHHLGRMERRGLIRRENSAADSRGAEVVLGERGAADFHGATVPYLNAIRELFVDALTPEQILAAGEIARALYTHLDGRG